MSPQIQYGVIPGFSTIKGKYISIVCVLFNFVAYYFYLLPLVHNQAALKSDLKKKDAIIIPFKSNNHCLERDLSKIITNLQHDVSSIGASCKHDKPRTEGWIM